MTRAEVAAMVAGIGPPAAYYQFDEGTAEAPPFITYYYLGRDDVFADDRNYSALANLVVELYTDAKDVDTEQAVETALQAAGMTYTTTETTIDSEKLYMVAYNMEVNLNG